MVWSYLSHSQGDGDHPAPGVEGVGVGDGGVVALLVNCQGVTVEGSLEAQASQDSG